MNKELEIKIMKERAAKLAEPIIEHDSTHDVEFILFSLIDASEYGIAYEFVDGIIKPDSVAWVPCAPDAIAGVVSWRGSLLTVVDVSVLFGGAPQARKRSSWVVIVQHAGQRLGLLVSSVVSNKTFSAINLQACRASDGDKKSAYIQGTFAENIAILNVDSLFSSKNLMF